VRVISSPTCPEDSVIVLRLLRSLDASMHDLLCVLSFEGRAQAEALHIAPLFDPGATDYAPALAEYFRAEARPVSPGSAFLLCIEEAVRSFRIVRVLHAGHCVASKRTGIVLLRREEAPLDAITLGCRFSDLALTAEVLDAIRRFVEVPMKHAALLKSLGVRRSSCVVIYGGPGSGKSSILVAISRGEIAKDVLVNVREAMTLGAEQATLKLCECFKYVRRHAPAMLLLDDVDAMAGVFTEGRDAGERRLAAMFVALLDLVLAEPGTVVVATAGPRGAAAPWLRRIGRFAHEIELGDPGPSERAEIMRLNTVGVAVDPGVIAELSGPATAGRSCAQVAEVAMIAVNNMIQAAPGRRKTRFIDDEHIMKAAQNKLAMTHFPVTVVPATRDPEVPGQDGHRIRVRRPSGPFSRDPIRRGVVPRAVKTISGSALGAGRGIGAGGPSAGPPELGLAPRNVMGP